jgi:hypothetical protein
VASGAWCRLAAGLEDERGSSMGIAGKVIEWIYKKSAEVSAYEMIDGYVSKPGGRGDEDVQVEARSLSSAPGFDKGKLVDKLIDGAKERRAKAAKQRAEGRPDLADRTEEQARSLEVAAEEINKQLPAAKQRKVNVAPKPGAAPAEPEERPEEGPHTAAPRPGNRPALLLAGGGILAVLVVGLFVVLGGDGGGSGGGGDGSGAAAVGGGNGEDQVYEIRGPVSEVSGCGDAGPEMGSEQRATTGLRLTDGKFAASLGAVSEVFGAYSKYEGVLREDGSFHLVDDDPLPATAGPSVLDGKFTDTGDITGKWTVGVRVPDHDVACAVTLEPLESSFYFGVEEIDWRQAFGVK